MTEFIPLIPAAPLVGFLVNLALAARWRGATSAPPVLPTLVGVLAAAASFVLALLCVIATMALPGRTATHALWTWIPGAAATPGPGVAPFTIEAALRLDPLSAVMVLIVTFVGALIHVYSVGYMGKDPGYARFMAYLNLFLFAMLVLVLGANYLVLFVGWEGVGLCSYLLIGFWYERPAAAAAGKKAFIVNRAGDAAFLLGVFLIFTTFGTVDFQEVAAKLGAWQAQQGAGALTAIGLLLFAGACGKSAQLPLHVWLPDAMEGPTPVSALIHAATMVTAGVYIVARSSALYAHAPDALIVIALVGAATALVAAAIGLVQNDIKRVLAYSTVSQLGYMFLSCGVAAYAAAMFHLLTHAFFKALLFLAAGSVIHALSGEQDLRRMGGLRSHLPWTHAAMLVGCLAIAGLPPLAGFFSKDEILWSAFHAGGPGRLVWGVGLLTAALTAFYMFRLYALTFAGSHRGPPEALHHVHEAPASMRFALVILALGAAFSGLLGVPGALGGGNRFAAFLHGMFAEAGLLPGAASHGSELMLMVVSVAIAVIGVFVALGFYLRPSETPGKLASGLPRLHRAFAGRFFFDELYDTVLVRGATLGGGRLFDAFDRRVVDGGDGEVRRGFGVNGLAWLCRDIVARLSNAWDRYVVDGMVNLTAAAAENASYLLRSLQNGFVQRYAWLMLAGALALMVAGRLVLGVD